MIAHRPIFARGRQPHRSRSLLSPARPAARLAITLAMGGALARIIVDGPEIIPGWPFPVMGLVAVAVAYACTRGPRWCLAMLLTTTLLGLYRYSRSVGTVDIRVSDIPYVGLFAWAVVLRKRDPSLAGTRLGQRQIAAFVGLFGLTLTMVLLNHWGGFTLALVSWLRFAVTASLIWLVPYALKTSEDRRFVIGSVILAAALEVGWVVGTGGLHIGGDDRLGGELGPNTFGCICGALIVLAAHAPVPRQRLARLLLVALGVVGLLGSKSVGALAATALALATIGLGQLFGASHRRTIAGLRPTRALLMVVGAVALIGVIRPSNLPGEAGYSSSTTSHRILLGTAGLELFLQHPVLGVGWQQSARQETISAPELGERLRERFPTVNPNFYPDEPTSVHNAYAQMLAEGGAVGFGLLALVIVIVGRSIRAITRRIPAGHPDRLVVRSAVGVLLIILIWWNDVPFYGAQPETILAATMLGVLASFRVGTDETPGADDAKPVRTGRILAGAGPRPVEAAGPDGELRLASNSLSPTRPMTRPSSLPSRRRVGSGSRSRARSPSRATAPQPLSGVTIAHFGHFQPDYARNRIMAKALRRAGATIVEISDQRQFARRTASLLARALPKHVDLILVGFPGHIDVPAAKAVGMMKKVPVVFDPLISLYETEVEDRGAIDAGSLEGRRYWAMDELACRLADLILLDTEAHINSFTERFGVSGTKFRRVFVGADDEVMYPRAEMPGTEFHVFFYGKFIPLHGIEHVVRAAHLLEGRREKVKFTIVGSGQTYREVRTLADDLGVASVTFVQWCPYEKLPAMMAESDLCLGIFGTSDKAQLVIPNKVFDALAMARPVVTADTAGAREALVHGEHAWLCRPGDPASLAEAISRLKADPATRKTLADNGHALFRRRFSIDALAAELARILAPLVGR